MASDEMDSKTLAASALLMTKRREQYFQAVDVLLDGLPKASPEVKSCVSEWLRHSFPLEPGAGPDFQEPREPGPRVKKLRALIEEGAPPGD